VRAARRQSEARAARIEADLTHAQVTASSADAPTVRLKLEIEKLRRTLYGARSEPKERLVDQLEMQLEESRPTRAPRALVVLPRGATKAQSGMPRRIVSFSEHYG